MPTTTPNMGLTKPDPGGSIGTWSTELNATIDLTDSHDHAAGNGVQIPVAGLDIDADLPLNGFGLLNLKVSDFAAVLASSVTGYVTALYVNSADNELYWRTNGGVDVQLTDGNSLNATLLGGFTGDYGAGGSTASFNSGTSIFNFLRAANHRAFIDCSDIRLFEGTVGITNAVKIRSPAGLAASYDFILPTALPGAVTEILQLSSAGQVVASNTMGLNRSIAISGTAFYKRPARRRSINPCSGSEAAGTVVTIGTANGGQVQLNEVFLVPLTVEEGERITAVEARVRPDGVGDVIRMRVFRVDSSGTGIPTRTQLGGDQNSSAVSGNAQTLTVSGLTESVGTSQFTYHAEFVSTAIVVNAVNVSGVWLTTDVP